VEKVKCGYVGTLPDKKIIRIGMAKNTWTEIN
jgi:hypothetical protein